MEGIRYVFSGELLISSETPVLCGWKILKASPNRNLQEMGLKVTFPQMIDPQQHLSILRFYGQKKKSCTNNRDLGKEYGYRKMNRKLWLNLTINTQKTEITNL